MAQVQWLDGDWNRYHSACRPHGCSEFLLLQSNTASSDDELVRAPFEPLWYGEPGPREAVERHARSVAPVSLDGRTQGTGPRQELVAILAGMGVDVAAAAAAEGFVTRWRLLGPCNTSPAIKNALELLDVEFVSVPDVDLSARHEVGKRMLQWGHYTSNRGVNDLGTLWGGEQYVAAYAWAEVVLPHDQEIRLKTGSDTALRCWFNGEVAGEYVLPYQSDCKVDQRTILVNGRKGRNTVLLKSSHLRVYSPWEFALRVVDAAGRPIEGLQPPVVSGKGR